MSDDAPITQPEMSAAKRYHKGFVADPHDHRVTSARHLLGVGVVRFEDTADSSDLTAHCPGIFDQAQTGSCTGHAIALGIACEMSCQGTPLDEPPSPVEIYNLALCIDREPNADGTLPALEDLGAQPNQAMRALTLWGTVPFSVFGPATPANVLAEPTFGELIRAHEVRFDGYFAIDPSAADFIPLLRKTLESHPVVLAIRADDAFMQWDPSTGPIGPSDGRPTDHYICAVGYRTVNGETILKIANSWGKDGSTPSGGWGVNGYGELSEARVRQCTSLFAMSLRKAA